MQFSDTSYTQLSIFSSRDTGHQREKEPSLSLQQQAVSHTLATGWGCGTDRSSARCNDTAEVHGHSKFWERCRLILVPCSMQGFVSTVIQHKKQKCIPVVQSLDGSRPAAALACCYFQFSFSHLRVVVLVQPHKKTPAFRGLNQPTSHRTSLDKG